MTAASTHTSFTGTIPENYDTYLGPLLFEFSAADMAHRVADELVQPGKVLEVACGTGISTRHLANTLPVGTKIIATDLNEAMLTHAAKVNGGLPGVSFSQADALNLPFEDASFDAVVCQFGVMFFPDKDKGMSEMTRVLKPSGVLALNVWGSFDKNPAVRIVDGVIKGYFDTDPPRFLEVPFGLSDVSKVRRMFADAGYPSVDVAHVTEAVETLDYMNVARGFVTGNPTMIEIEQRASVDVEEIVTAAAAALECSFGPVPVNLEFQEIVYLGRKPSV